MPDDFPLTLAQRDIYFDQLRHPDSPLYNVGGYLRLGRIDLGNASSAHRAVVRGSDAFGIRVLNSKDGVRQRVVHERTTDLPLIDLSASASSLREAEDWIARLFETPLVVEDEELFRAFLIRITASEHWYVGMAHHVAIDGWGFSNWGRAFADHYGAASTHYGAASTPLEAPRWQEIASDDALYLLSSRYARDMAYWRSQCEPLPDRLLHPFHASAHAPQSGVRSLRRTFHVGVPALQSMRRLADRLAVSNAHVLLGAVVSCLGIGCGRRDVMVGLPIHNRRGAAQKRAIGVFTGVSPLRLVRSAGQTFSQFVREVADRQREGFRHRRYPMGDLIRDLRRSFNESDLYDIGFSYLRFDERLCVEGHASTLVYVSNHHEPTPLMVTAWETGEEGIDVELDCNQSYFTAGEAALLVERLKHVLHSVLESPDRELGLADVLPVVELGMLLRDFNATSAAYPKTSLIHEPFEAQVAARPDSVAVVYETQRLTYGELNARANRLAHALIRQGVQLDDRVAICVERSLGMVVGLLGILKAGAAYVPLDPESPSERLAYMLADSAPVALLTHARLADRLPAHAMPTLHLEAIDTAALAAGPCVQNPDVRARGLTSRHLAYVIYTSGSTGQPKGVMVEHASVMNLITSHCAQCALTPEDRILQFASFAFDASVEEIFPALSVGAAIVVRPAHLSLSNAAFSDYLDRHGITVAELPTAFWHQWALAREAPACRSLRLVVVGGEKAQRRALQTWKEAGGMTGCGWLNTYGPTESTVYSVAIAFDETSAFPENEIPIGRPIANTCIRILDGHGALVPVGVVGELYIGGAGVARGYLNQPALTAERFLQDPYDTDPEARLYRTGDLGRWRPDGIIEFCGRNDLQVKIRGFRIELEEIEAALSASEGVRETVVVAREDTAGDKRLVAYLIADAEAPLSATVLRERLMPRLPEYMIPSAFVTVDAFPLTRNGKIDRQALPVPDAAALAHRGYEAPEGEIEETLARIWSELLCVKRIGRHDHFFELGGHSLLVVTLVERLRESGLGMAAKTIFTAPTLCMLAAVLGRTSGDAQQSIPANLIGPDATAITPAMLPLVTLTQDEIDRIVATVPAGIGNVQDIYPLLPMQEGLLFHHLLEEKGDTYLARDVLAFDSRDRLNAFLDALNQVIVRHEILRSAMLWEGLPQPVQVVYRHAPLSVSEFVPSATEDAAEMLHRSTHPAQTRLDVRRAPLLAAYVAHDRIHGEWLLALLHHHLVCDHVTLERALIEVQAALRGAVASLPAALPFRTLVAQARQTPVAVHEAYFRQELGDIDEPTAPFGVLDVKSRGTECGESIVPIDAGLARRIRSCARREGLSPAVLLHVAWAQVLARCTGRDEIVFGTVLSGRLQSAPGADRVLGMTINTLPVRVSLGERSTRQVLQESYRRMQALLTHEQAPLALAQRCSGVPQPLPLFTTLLNYRHGHVAADEGFFSAVQGIRLVTAEEVTNYPITIAVDDLANGFTVRAQCAAEIGADRITHYLLEALEGLVNALDEGGERRIREIDVLPPAERAQVLEAFNATEVAYPQDRLIHEAFEAQAARNAAADALIHGEEMVSYGELNRRANRVAHRLIGLGVKPDDRVAICMQRSVELVVGVLGILKAGGAYVPLDPGYPAERLAYMLGDSAPVALLTQLAVEDSLPALSLLRVLVVDDDDDDGDGAVIARQPEDNPSAAAMGQTSRHLAYVIYTSGSTGQPKGVMVEHASVMNLWTELERSVFNALPDHARVGLNASLSFDASVQSLTQLLSGRCVVVIPREIRADAAALLDFLGGHRVDAFDCTPGQLELLLAEGLLEGHVYRPQAVLVGGEAIAANIWQRLARSASIRFFNVYGPTECTVDSTIICINGAGDYPQIGRPIANTQVYILDARREPVPVGGKGEIYIGGVQVARGYLNRPELTAERFIDDPYSAVPGARLYRTGDLGRWRADGTIEYLGRNDFQVKIRGFRIELGEIEATLSACEGVREAVVVAREDTAGDKRLVAYVVPEPEAEVSVAGLRERLSRELAEYMVPSAFVRLEALPLTPNGKLDRGGLPAPDQAAVASRGYEAPVGEVEETIARIWGELLGLAWVGRHDHFFELGGHSLLAVRLATHLRTALGVELALREVFAQPTLSALAQAVGSASASAQPPLVAVDRSAGVPLSWAQQRLWFLDQLDHAAGAAYHVPAALRLSGELDGAALRASLDRIVARHEILRTRFVSVDGAPRQAIAAADSGFTLVETDLGDLDAAAQAAAVTALGADEARAPFDLSTGPLIRGRLLRLSGQEHVLLVTQHHIISDGWSTGVLVKEVSALYTALRQGEADPLPPLAIQYADYAVWQRTWLQGEVLQGQIDFWKTQLAGAPGLLQLPTDRPRPAVQSYAGDQVAVEVPAELATALRSLSQRRGVTLFMTLLASWSVLLSRLSGQDEVVIGSPVANRRRTEIEPLIGFFVNTLALRVDLTGDPSVAELLSQVKATTLGAYAHQDLPFEQVVEALQPERSLGHSPLFQVMLSLNNTPDGGELHLPGLTLSAVETADRTAQFDLLLSLTDSAEGLSGSLLYATDLFDRPTVERLVGHWVTVLGAMVAGESEAVSRLPLLTSAERTQVLVAFNATDVEYPRDRLIHEVFEAQAARDAGADALIHGEEVVSYGELNRRANRVAHRLLGLGVKPDDRVAICMQRSVELVVGVLGILKAGGAYVPLDPGYPAERLAYMLGDSAPVALLTQSALQATLSAPGVTAVPMVVVDDDAALGQASDANPDRQAIGQTSRHLAYVIYTSGSTGQPKGVMIEHGQVARLFAATQAWFAFDETDVWTLFHSIAFDFSVWEIWGALLHGGRLVVVPTLCARTPSAFYDLLVQHGVTVLNQTPSAFGSLIAAQAQSAAAHRLRTVIFGGEALEVQMLAPWMARNDPQRTQLINMYGITEITVHATYRPITAADLDLARVSQIGRPIPDLQVYVLDGQRAPVPIGVSGELYIGGAGLARGYLNRPELTAERFIDDPYSAVPGARLYKTGDLGRWRADGTIEYLGRNDFQVKIRGFRIELGEIEATLSACEGVREAVVVAREDTAGDKRLVAYVVPEPEAEVSVAGLRERLSRELAEYMVPSAFVRLEALPLTPNGKLDRGGLPAPDQAAVASRGYEAPVGEVEETIARIWGELLGLARVGRHDHFFELGGHSLLATRLASRLHEHLAVVVQLRELFAYPILAGFADRVMHARHADQIRIPLADRTHPLPLSWAQQRLWFINQFDPAAGAAYHMPTALRLSGRLDTVALRGTLDRVLVRHESLRTTFAVVEGEPVQVIAPATVGFRLIEHDLAQFSEPEQYDLVARIAAEEAVAAFDLASGPLIRGQLLRLSDDEHVLLITQHHIVSDGWSVGVLIEEVGALYAAFCQGQADPLPPLAFQYADYALWQRNRSQEMASECRLAFWKAHLDGAPALLELPTDQPRPPVQRHTGSRIPVSLPAPLVADLDTFSQRHGVTAFMTLLTAWATVLSRLSGQAEVVIGTPVANRQHVQIEPLIGFFVNTLALRVNLNDNPTLAQLLEQVRCTMLAAYEHQDIPFEQVVDALQPARSLSHSPVFQVMLALDNTPTGSPLSLPGLTLSPVEQAVGTANFDLSLSLRAVDDGMQGNLDYASDLFTPATVTRWAGYFIRVLTAMVDSEGTLRANGLSLLDDAERQQLDGFNATAAAYPKTSLIHEPFEAQAAAQPDAVAVIYETQRLTYGELNARANRLAHALIRQGVQPDDRVAICVERSVGMVVGLLGILKAGAAYVPLDPESPSERLAYMLADSAPVALLTQARLADRLPAHAMPTLQLEAIDTDALAAGPCVQNPDVRARGLTSRHLAYVIYTSGSTGQPKGVMVEHASVMNLITSHCAQCALTPEDRILQFASFAFDASVKEIFPTLSVGASMVVRPAQFSLSNAAFSDYLDRHGITVAGLPTAFWHQWALAREAPACPSLRLVVVGGEKAQRRALQAWKEAGGMAGLGWLNAYGPTEITVYSAAIAFNETSALPENEIPIGRPTANAQIHILDGHGGLVPIGVAGELYIGGAGVARGYLNRPALTAERFLKDPYSADPEARLYRSGDLGRWRPDGTIEYLGRNDFQVKISGFRIELGEVEAALATCAAVREAVVMAREDAAGEKHLVAYLIAHPGTSLSAAALREHLVPRLPGHMIPSAFVTVDAFPLTRNGKIDREALQAPSITDRAIAATRIAAGNHVERALAAIWAERLDLPAERISVTDSFFEIGGNSLLSIAVQADIKRVLGIEVGMASLFQYPTIQYLARFIDGIVESPADRSATIKSARDRLLRTRMQRRLNTGNLHVDSTPDSNERIPRDSDT